MARKRPPAERPQTRAFSIVGAEVCPLCLRTIPKAQRDLHHWIPKLKGGKVSTALHRICHRQIHAQFSEAQLAQTLNTPEALLQEPSIQTFVEWVKKKPDSFYETTRSSNGKRGKIRRG